MPCADYASACLRRSVPEDRSNTSCSLMAGPEDLQWILREVESGSETNLQTISFHLNVHSSSSVSSSPTCLKIVLSKKPHPSLFSILLTELLLSTSASRRASSTFRSLEFHQFEWQLETLQSLASLLLSTTAITQLFFHNNRFDPRTMRELSEMMKMPNCSIKDITFSESNIGPLGGPRLLASALTLNYNVEELQLWDDHIGSSGAEELSKMIEANPSLKLLTIFDSSPCTAAPLVSPALARNRALEVHAWFWSWTTAKITGRQRKTRTTAKAAELVPDAGTLRVFRMDLTGATRIACALGMNTTVRCLDMSGVRLRSEWAREFRWVLEKNHTLREVKLSSCGLKDKAAIYIGAALFKNKRLETLFLDANSFSAVGVDHLLCPFTRFYAPQIQANTTLKSLAFGGRHTTIGTEAVVQMVTTNQSLTYFGICNDQSLKPEDLVQLFRALEKNASLRRLSLAGCTGVDGETVLKAIMKVLQVNPWIEDIDLAMTPLHIAGKCEGVYNKLRQKEKLETPDQTHNHSHTTDDADVESFKNMPMAAPKSCRVFLCGHDHSGKSTLGSVISHLSSSNNKLPYIDQVRTLVNPVEQAVKPERKINIKTFKDGDTNISLWNFAGHHDVCPLHHFMFPGHGSPSIFLIVSSLFTKYNSKDPPKTPAEIEDDVCFWLRFIISNSRRAVQQCMLPTVTIVLTHYDRISPSSEDLLASYGNCIQRLKDRFQGLLDFHPTVFTIDARSSASAAKLNHHIKHLSKAILDRVPRVYQLCNDLVTVISDWRCENYNKPVMTWVEFGHLCQSKVPTLRIHISKHDSQEKTETKRRAVATTLHQIGEVIYFDNPNILILDFEWFSEHVLGLIPRLNAKDKTLTKDNGFVTRTDLDRYLRGNLQTQIPLNLMMSSSSTKVFKDMEPSDLLRIMIKLELAFEQDPSLPNSPLLIHSLLNDTRQKPQRWQFTSPECIYAGRHLDCEDSTLLLPSFFPRLQVQLYNKIMKLQNQHGATCGLDKYLISININGINVRIELGGQQCHHIDILACSTKSLTETLRLIHQLIVPTIYSLCPVMILIESIIRPDCIQSLTPPRYRKTQLLPVKKLKQALLSVPAESMYDYQHTWSAVSDSGRSILSPGFDLARDLLSDDDFREVLHRRYHDLYNLATELQIPPESNTDGTSDDVQRNNDNAMEVDPSIDGIAKGVERVLKRLKIIEQEIRDLKQEIQGLRYYEHRLLIELHRKVDHLVNYNVQIEERKAPNMFFFVRTDNYSRKLITTVIPGMDALRLHMLCEYRREMHVVEDQMGCEVMKIDNEAVKSLAPYLTGFMKLVTFALKIGAHLAAGMGELIPDLGREVAHLATSSSILTGVAAAGAIGAVVGATGRNKYRRDQRDVQQEQRAAQQWVLDFLRERNCSSGKDIAEKFGLWRVRYLDSGQIAWICRRHLSLRAHEVIEVPI